MDEKRGQNFADLIALQSSKNEKIKKPRLLVIAADDDIRQSAVKAGKKENFVVRAVDNGSDAMSLLFNTVFNPFDLIIVEHALPGLGSDAVCREIRKNDLQTPILIMSAESSEIDLILSLETGADDFYTKPFSLPILAAKSRALLRRTIAQNQKKKDKSPIQLNCCKTLVLYEDECRIAKKGVDVELAPLEYKLIKLLMENPKVVWSRERLIEKVWGFDYAGNTKTVDVHIRWLREKIEDDPSAPKIIKTVRGFGYRFC